MGWYEWLSGSNKEEGARPASVAEHVEIKHWRAGHKPLKSDESLAWEGHLFTGYHLHKVDKNESTEYVKLNLDGNRGKINTRR